MGIYSQKEKCQSYLTKDDKSDQKEQWNICNRVFDIKRGGSPIKREWHLDKVGWERCYNEYTFPPNSDNKKTSNPHFFEWGHGFLARVGNTNRAEIFRIRIIRDEEPEAMSATHSHLLHDFIKYGVRQKVMFRVCETMRKENVFLTSFWVASVHCWR